MNSEEDELRVVWPQEWLRSGSGKCPSELRGLRQLLASRIGVMMVVMIGDGDQVDMVTET